MKKALLIFICTILMFASLVSCSEYKPSDDKLLIVVTAFPHYDFTRQIVKDTENVEIRMLISPGREVHTYDPSVEDMASISECDILICTGGHSDIWLDSILESCDNKDMTVVSFMEICSDGSHEEHEHTHEHSKDEEHDHYDEHVWTSPVFASQITSHICEVLCKKDPGNAEIYKKNRDGFISELSNLDKEFSDIAASASRKEIIVADRFPFQHLVTEYSIEYSAAYPGCSSSTEPSALTVANLSQKVKNDDIPVVFTIEFSNQSIAQNVVEATDTKILTLHSCHNVSAEDFEKGITYIDLMKQNAQNLRKALCE